MSYDASITESLEVRVPGKAILAGEHFVLYGVRAIAAPVPARMLSLRLAFRTGKDFVLPEPYSHCAEAVSAILGEGLRGFVRLWSTSEIPQGAGLGSSAAFAVALGRALALFSSPDEYAGGIYEGKLKDAALERKAMEVARVLEESIHGKASGIDTAAVASNGAIVYSMEKGFTEKLCVSRDFSFMLIDTGERRSTRMQIEEVAVHRNREPELFRALAKEAAVQVEALVEGMSQGSRSRAFEAIASLGELLGALGLESSESRALRESMASRGLALKVTGAGGGGFLLGLAADDEKHRELLAAPELAGRVLEFSVPAYIGLDDRQVGGLG